MDNNIMTRNLDLPIASSIREFFVSLPQAQQKELLESMSLDEFIEHRVDLYFESLENALQSGTLHPVGAEEVARKEAMSGMLESTETLEENDEKGSLPKFDFMS
ncbi:MAG: hypothetical protein ACKO1F_08885 [Flammeovirgaceae bacterium]